LPRGRNLQADPRLQLQKITFTPRAVCKSDVKRSLLSAFKSRNDFLGRSDEAECARQVIGRPKRENAQWNAAIDKPAGHLCSSTVTAGRKHEVRSLLESFLETAFFRGLINGVMPSLGQCRHQLLPAMFGVTSLGIVY
jgi:hypothetical protein